MEQVVDSIIAFSYRTSSLVPKTLQNQEQVMTEDYWQRNVISPSFARRIKGIPFDKSQALYDASEKQLHQYFHQIVSPDFYTAHEVEGRCLIDHPAANAIAVRADFLLYPRRHLLDEGFADTWFAVEIKRGKEKLENACRQAFWYTVSEFEIKGRKITPGFAVAWVPSRPEHETKKEDRETQRYREGFDFAIKSSFGYLNVGTMQLNIKNYAAWQIWMLGKYAQLWPDNSCQVLKNRTKFLVKVGNGQQIVSHSGMEGLADN